MTNKTYNQYCGVAHALDIVGERWTLLVVRNLLILPQRFGDLRKSLPGISTNILADRLDVLEKHGVVTTRYLPPPAASTVYELTEQGRGLTAALAALARWGSQTLGTPQKEQYVVMESVCFMLQGLFWRDEQLDVHLTINAHIKDAQYDQTFGVALSKSGVLIGAAYSDADVELTMKLEMLSPLSSYEKQLRLLEREGAVEVKGENANLDTLYSWLER